MSFINESASAAPNVPSVAGAGLGFMSKIVTTAFNHILQQELIEDERDWQKEQFHMENSYNSPVAMAQRMRHAGLNPYAMTGQQVAGSFNSGSYPTLHPMEDPFENIVKAAQIANINADTQVKENEAEISYQEARMKAVEADNYEEYWQLTLAHKEKEGKLADSQIEKLRAETQKEFELARKAKEDADQFEEFGDSGGNTYSDTSSLTQSQTRLNDATTALNTARTEYQNILNSNADAKEKAEIKEKLAAAQKSVADALASEMQAAYTETLEYNASQQEARAAALHIYEEYIKQYEGDVKYQESVIKHMEAIRAEMRTNEPFSDDGNFGGWVFYNLFGENGFLSF